MLPLTSCSLGWITWGAQWGFVETKAGGKKGTRWHFLQKDEQPPCWLQLCFPAAALVLWLKCPSVPGAEFGLGSVPGSWARWAGVEHGLGTGSRKGFYAALDECCPAAFVFMNLLCLCSLFVSDLSRKDFFCLKSDVFCSIGFKNNRKKQIIHLLMAAWFEFVHFALCIPHL